MREGPKTCGTSGDSWAPLTKYCGRRPQDFPIPLLESPLIFAGPGARVPPSNWFTLLKLVLKLVYRAQGSCDGVSGGIAGRGGATPPPSDSFSYPQKPNKVKSKTNISNSCAILHQHPFRGGIPFRYSKGIPSKKPLKINEHLL